MIDCRIGLLAMNDEVREHINRLVDETPLPTEEQARTIRMIMRDVLRPKRERTKPGRHRARKVDNAA